MSDLAALYQDIIIDHGKSPRNYRVLPEANRSAEGYNPLCGDRVRVEVDVQDETIADAAFQGEGCAICTASASLMTDAVKNRSVEDVSRLIGRFQALLTSEAEQDDLPPRLHALAGVRRYPMRVKCATLAWHTLKAALAHSDEVVTTE